MTATKGRKRTRTTKANADENVLRIYLKEINRIALLTREEEAQIARIAARGDTAARNRLVSANLRFVVSVAKKYQGHGISLADLISEGNIGLILAIERFNADRGYRFISYAVWWIRQSIIKALYEKSRLIRLPANRASDLVQMEKARKMLSGNGNAESEIREIAQMLDVGENYVADTMAISREVLSLEKLLDSEKGAASLGNCVVDNRYDAPEQAAMQKFLENDIEEILGTLNFKEAEIIRLRFGLGKREPLSLQEIGDRFNLTKERIRQIEEKALLRLQHRSRSIKLEDYVA
ncbi:MAG: RNA polymerase sigma factor RpoD/SigA [Treponema sp.]|nr:RNA polymerase sigma factor RpoD/SigA [Treponema sp.]